ncbi:MAG: trypsin-like serine protease [Burkholderiales bacterium]
MTRPTASPGPPADAQSQGTQATLRRAALALLACAALFTAAALPLTESLLPLYRAQVAWLTPELRVLDVRVTRAGRDSVVAVTATLARPVATRAGLLLPDARGRIEASTLLWPPFVAWTVLFAVLVAWPADSRRTVAWRLAGGLPLALALAALDLPATLVAALDAQYSEASLSATWSGFMQRGGRLVLAAGAALATIACVRWMTRARAARQALALAAAAFTLALPASEARAVVAGAPPDSPTARVDANLDSSPFAGVGSVRVGAAVYSGVLVGRRAVLTAAHTVAGADVTTLRFQLNAGASPSHDIGVVARHVHPDFTGFSSTNPHNDLAILELAESVPASVPAHPLWRSPLSPGTVLWLVGYGGSGNGSTGLSAAANPTIKRVGRNSADVFRADDGGSGVQEVYIFDFDGAGAANVIGGPTLGNAIEATLAGGDSGSPAFVQVGSAWHLAGINTFVGGFAGGPTTPGVFGTAGGGQSVAGYLAWIDATLAGVEQKYAQAEDIPLPLWALLLLGSSVGMTLRRLGLTGSAGRKLRTGKVQPD